jgi:hypothetical protein
MPDNSNFNTKETEKLNTYKDLKIGVSWKQKAGAKIVPVIIEALRQQST